MGNSMHKHDVHIYRNNDSRMLDNTMTMLMVDTTFFCVRIYVSKYPLSAAATSPSWAGRRRCDSSNIFAPSSLRGENFYDANKQTKNTGFHFMATNHTEHPHQPAAAAESVPTLLSCPQQTEWLSPWLPCHSPDPSNGKFITRADKYGAF